MLYVNAAELKCCESPDKMLVGKITKVQGAPMSGIFLDSGCVWIGYAAWFSLIVRNHLPLVPAVVWILYFCSICQQNRQNAAAIPALIFVVTHLLSVVTRDFPSMRESLLWE